MREMNRTESACPDPFPPSIRPLLVNRSPHVSGSSASRRHRKLTSIAPSWLYCCRPSPRWTIRAQGDIWGSTRTGCATGDASGPQKASAWPTRRDAGARPLSPPLAVATVKALACDLPVQRGEPLSRYSTAAIARLMRAHPDAPALSPRTIWRLLDRDALTPWRYRRWLFPRDPPVAEKAGRVLDLSAGCGDGQPLHPDDCTPPQRRREDQHPSAPAVSPQPATGPTVRQEGRPADPRRA